MFTVNQIFTTALRPFSGASRNSFTSPNGIVADAVRSVRTNVDLIESKRTVPLTPALYVGDNVYNLPEDVDVILDLYPMSGRSESEPANFNRATAGAISRDYNHQKIQFAEDWLNGDRLLRVQPGAINDTPIILNDCNSLTDNGTVAVSGDADSLQLNKIFYLNGSAAIDFNITPSTGTATFSITGMTAVDISTITRDGAFTMGVYIPDELVSNLTNVTLRVGSDANNYYEMTATTNAYGGDLTFGYNIVRFEKREATETGTVDEEAITYLSGDVTHTLSSAVTGVKIDAIAAHKGQGYNLDYYSTNLFKSHSTGAWIAEPTNAGLLDKLHFSKDAYELVVNEARKLMDLELRGEKAGSVYQLAERELNGIWGDFSRPGMYTQYRLRYPSERPSVVTQYEAYPYE